MDDTSLLVLLSQLTQPQLHTQAEQQLNLQLNKDPETLLSNITTISINGQDDTIRTLATVLFRTLVTKKVLPKEGDTTLGTQYWDLVSEQARQHIQSNLLHALANAATKKPHERNVICDAIATVEKAGQARGVTWPSLGVALAQLFSSPDLNLRQSSLRIYSEVPSLLHSAPPNQVISGLSSALADQSIGVRLTALTTCVNLLKDIELAQVDKYQDLVGPMLAILPPMSTNREEGRLNEALLPLIDLFSTPKIPSRLLKPHLASLTTFSLSLLTPSPFPLSPHYSPTGAFDDNIRQPALELLVSLAETAPSMCRNYVEFGRKVTVACLGVMGEIGEDKKWEGRESFDEDDEEDSMAVVAESALDRIAQSLGGPSIFPTFVQTLPSLLSSPSWQYKSAALSAIASLAEGCIEQFSAQTKWIIGVVLPAMKDDNVRVRYAAIYAIGQLCTDSQGLFQEVHGKEVLEALVGVSRGPESRVQAYATAAMVNFFDTAEYEPIAETLPLVFHQLVTLLQNGTNFVKENAMQALGQLAECMEKDFTPLYPAIMPDLLNLLEAKGNKEIEKLRNNALDCVPRIARAADSSVFALDSSRLLTAMHNMQLELASSPSDDNEATQRTLLTAFASLADIVGVDAFRPYIEDAFPRLVALAQKKPDLTISSVEEDEEEEDDEEDWDKLELNGDVVAIRSSEMDSKCEALESLVLLVQAVRTALPLEALQGILEFTVPLLKFYFSMAVREASAHLIAVTVQGIASANLSFEQRQSVANAISEAFSECIAIDTDAEIISTFISTWTACYVALPGCLNATSREHFVKALEAQLVILQKRETERLSGEEEDDEDDIVDLEDIEENEAVFECINDALNKVLMTEGTAFPIQPILPFLAFMTGASTSSTQFALRLTCDLIHALGPDSQGAVRGYLDRVHNCLSDSDPTTRRIAAYCVGVAAEHVAYLDFVTASIDVLFATIGPLDETSPLLAARDNSVSAIGKIIRHQGEQQAVHAEALLPRWVAALPIMVDLEEMTPSYTLLLELIARGHPSVAPATSSLHVTKVLVSALENEVLPGALHRPLAQALKSYLQSVPSGTPTAPISPHLEAKVTALLEDQS